MTTEQQEAVKPQEATNKQKWHHRIGKRILKKNATPPSTKHRPPGTRVAFISTIPDTHTAGERG